MGSESDDSDPILAENGAQKNYTQKTATAKSFAFFCAIGAPFSTPSAFKIS